jgi:hypothetical protein
MNAFPRSMTRGGQSHQHEATSPPSLKIVAAEITTSSKIVFPDMAHDVLHRCRQPLARVVRPRVDGGALLLRARAYPARPAARPTPPAPAGSRHRLRRASRPDRGHPARRRAAFELPDQSVPFARGCRGSPRSVPSWARAGNAPPSRWAAPLRWAAPCSTHRRQAADLDFIWRNPDYKRVISAIELDNDGDSKDDVKWSGGDSNAQPPACKAGTLPIELPPR